MELMEETRWARNALATSLESSDDHRFGKNLCSWDPVGIDTNKLLDGSKSSRSLLSPDKNSARIKQVINGSTLGKKFWVGKNLKLLLGSRGKDTLDGFGSSHRYG